MLRTFAALLLLLVLQPTTWAQAIAPNRADLTLEQLGNITITSVSGRAESLQDAAASVYVHYAISARGFNTSIGNKLLVLIDGRTVYSPLFSGVSWDANDPVLQDIDHTQGATASVVRSNAGVYEMARWVEGRNR